MTKISAKTRAHIETLVVAYHAFMTASHESDDLGLCVWGNILAEVQPQLGMEMMPAREIELTIKHARRRMDDRKAEVVA